MLSCQQPKRIKKETIVSILAATATVETVKQDDLEPARNTGSKSQLIPTFNYYRLLLTTKSVYNKKQIE